MWDDPDLVPVPVQPAYDENSISYEAHDVANTQGENTLLSDIHKQAAIDKIKQMRVDEHQPASAQQNIPIG